MPKIRNRTMQSLLAFPGCYVITGTLFLAKKSG